jgi:hypothetical protein
MIVAPLLFATSALAAAAVPAATTTNANAVQQQFVAFAPVGSTPTPVKADVCETCINTAEQVINQALNVIINAGVAGTCGKLCGAIENATKSKPIGEVCSLVCEVEGIKEFIKLIDAADLDPFYFCELAHICKTNDAGDATITAFASTPLTGKQGTTFAFELDFESKNGTGVGTIGFSLKTLDGVGVGSTSYAPAQAPGSYKGTFSVKTQPDPGCDPTKGPCENWLPGLYVAEAEICYGECGSKHPHSTVYDRATANFTITA